MALSIKLSSFASILHRRSVSSSSSIAANSTSHWYYHHHHRNHEDDGNKNSRCHLHNDAYHHHHRNRNHLHNIDRSPMIGIRGTKFCNNCDRQQSGPVLSFRIRSNLSHPNLSYSQRSFSSSSSTSVMQDADSSRPKSAILLSGNQTETKKSPTPDNNSKPNEDQLQALANRLGEHLPRFFKVPHDFRLYHRSIVFEDNIRNVRTTGLNAYAWQIALVKMGAHIRYAKVNLEILKITTHVTDGTVRVRWRVVSYPGNSMVFAFWQFKLWKTKESIEEYKDNWIDGFSIFEIGGDGLIHKHICDKVIPDTDKVEPKTNRNLAMKLGIALGLIPGEASGMAQNWLSELLSYLS